MASFKLNYKNSQAIEYAFDGRLLHGAIDELSINDLPPPVSAPPRREPLTAGCDGASGRPERSSPAAPTGRATRDQPSPAAARPAAAHVAAVLHYVHSLAAAPAPSACFNA